MKQRTPHPFTREQFVHLSPEQREAIEAVAEYLTGYPLGQGAGLTTPALSETFNLLKPCAGCVPEEEAGDNLLPTIRKKFAAVYQVGLELAEKELADSAAAAGFHPCLIIDPDYGDATRIAVVNTRRPICYLLDWCKAWHFCFRTLGEIADEVLKVKRRLTTLAAASDRPHSEMLLKLQGGLVREAVNVPAGLRVTVLDYDVDEVQAQALQLSPLDGEPCLITQY